MPNYTLRRIQKKDNPIIANIIRKALEEFNAAKPGTVYFDETTDSLSDLFKHSRSAYYILEVDGDIAGGAGFYPTEGLPDDTCELVKMYLSPSFRKKGLGEILLKHCASEAASIGYREMYIETMPELVNAISLYQKLGFHFLDHALGNSGHNGCDIWMLKAL